MPCGETTDNTLTAHFDKKTPSETYFTLESLSYQEKAFSLACFNINVCVFGQRFKLHMVSIIRC